MIHQKIKKTIRPVYYSIHNFLSDLIEIMRRKWKKISRIFFNFPPVDTYSFVILCVKNTAYVALAIRNINSLHYYNPNHKFIIHCDKICYDAFEKQKHRLDYGNRVEAINLFSDDNKPWQLFKIETLITASKNDQILIDADEIWHADPKIDRSKIIFQVLAYKIKSNAEESSLVSKLFGQPDWVEFDHFVTGFLSLPSKFMSEKLADDCRAYTKKVMENGLDFIAEEKRNDLRRIAEEICVNLAVQSNCARDDITALKSADPKGDKNVLQSLYYGCANKIIE